MKVVITGASSGLGREVAKLFIKDGHKVTVCARRMELLEELAALSPEVTAQYLDIDSPDCEQKLQTILETGGKTDLYFHASGIGCHNAELDPNLEQKVLNTNCIGFARCIDTAFNYFKANGGGHIAAISSIAGTMGLGAAPSYSASKAFNNTYLQALAQLSTMTDAKVGITDIRPGFVKTALLDSKRNYPMLMSVEYAARRIYKAICRKKRYKVIDWRYAILVWLWRMIPDWLWVRLKIDAHQG
ncbi:MAG: SDR family NAD(P)-dependent oxidoreductase [Bacteroidales bacterium]|nr:SDR family NAD(P)-dependent oxidoreductase [Bacteroidales bacterium]